MVDCADTVFRIITVLMYLDEKVEINADLAIRPTIFLRVLRDRLFRDRFKNRGAKSFVLREDAKFMGYQVPGKF